MNAIVRETDKIDPLSFELQKSWTQIRGRDGFPDRAAIAREVDSFLAAVREAHATKDFFPDFLTKSTFGRASCAFGDFVCPCASP
jgi:hypothetical protein